MSAIEREFALLLKAKSSTDVESIIEALGNQIDWVPLGGDSDNFGRISIGSDPFDGITERITNAMDAMVELRVELRPELKVCSSPRDAIQEIYGLPDGNLRNAPDPTVGELASNIQVKFLESDQARRPTIEFLDRGIGQHPSDFPETLVGLSRAYKLSKFYLIGAFGQGGQSSFNHAEYGIIISRKHHSLLRYGQSDLVGWTIVRYMDHSTATDIFKHGRYEYLVRLGTTEVPTSDPRAVPFAFENGTIVRLVSYELQKGSSDVLQPTSTAWGFLSQSLFDPILPIRLSEERPRFENRHASLSGLARRLWRGGRGEKVKVKVQDSYYLDLGADGSVRINYWALEPTDAHDKWLEIRRTFVSSGQAVFVTLNGQRHHVEPTAFLRDRANLIYSNNHLIVQVDCDNLTKQAKKRLIPSTRERLIEGEFKENLLDEIASFLRRDRNIQLFESQTKDRLTRVRSEIDTARIRRLVGQYIASNPVLKELIFSSGREKINGQKHPHTSDESDREEEEVRDEELVIPPLKSVPTYLRIANRRDPIPVEKGGNALVRLETDAEDSYFADDWDSHFRVTHVNNLTSFKSRSGLKNGKISYYVQCPSSTRIGSTEILRFELDLPNGPPLIVEREVTCVKPFERSKEPGKQTLPQPKIIPITKSENPTTWSEFSWNPQSLGRVFIGKTDKPGIYVSLDNEHYLSASKSKVVEPEQRDSIRDRYVAGVAYYLVLRYAQLKTGENSENGMGDSDDGEELQRVAQTLAAVSVPFDKLGN